MKKTLLVLLAFAMLFGLCACGSDDSKTTTSDSSQLTTNSTENSTGNTEAPTDVTEGTTVATQTPTDEPTTPPTQAPTNEPTETPTTPPTTCNHSWEDATCTAPKTCAKCAATEGCAAGHSWMDATCTSSRTCTKCGAIEGNPIGHSWKGATCTAPKTCTRCGITQGTVNNHVWIGATCVTPDTCYHCGATRGSTRDHSWQKQITKEPTYSTAGEFTYTCTICGESYTEVIEKYNFNPDHYANPYHIRTSENPDNYVDFTISGSTLYVTGKIIMDDLNYVWVECGDVMEIIPASNGKAFCIELSLKKVTEKNFVEIYTQRGNEPSYEGYLFRTVSVILNGGSYCFDASLVLQHNIDKMKKWIDPSEYIEDTISQELKDLSNQIVGDEKDIYKKMFLLNKWVAENIYYDYDYYEDRSNEVYYSANDVYRNRRTVCEGYANLLKVLLQAQGIPSVKVSTFSTGASTSGYFDESNYQTSKPNHAHVEAYLESENRWIILDPTWDSNNVYKNGKFIDDAAAFLYFDIGLDIFSFSHKIIRRG